MNVDYLRVSVTDRCNLRCVYCNPLGDNALADRREMLTFGEIHRLVRLCTECGIRRVRLTGGEPLVREGLVDLVRDLAGIGGIDELTLTTNGVLLEGVARELKEAGLYRVNISLDAAEPDCYERITGFDQLAGVLRGLHAAIDVGLTPVRINCVVTKDGNLDQIPALAEMSVRLPVSVRFIEYCPTSRRTASAGSYVPNREVRRIIESHFGPLRSVVMAQAGGPAVYFKIAGGPGAIGFISGRSSVFCQACSRLRLTSDGRIKPCLYAARSYDAKRLLRDGAADEAVVQLIATVIREKEHHTRVTASAGDFLMQNIGG